MKKYTKSTSAKETQRAWHLIDANDKILGRLASDIALLLMGKAKTNFVRNLDLGDYVVVINASTVKTTGKKETDKKYYRHSGYPGGLTTEVLQDLRQRRPQDVIIHAVSGMLPDNRLKKDMLGRLHVFPKAEHKFTDKFIK
jgi:large subunit ribosomal protein L13